MMRAKVYNEFRAWGLDQDGGVDVLNERCLLAFGDEVKVVGASITRNGHGHIFELALLLAPHDIGVLLVHAERPAECVGSNGIYKINDVPAPSHVVCVLRHRDHFTLAAFVYEKAGKKEWRAIVPTAFWDSVGRHTLREYLVSQSEEAVHLASSGTWERPSEAGFAFSWLEHLCIRMSLICSCV